MEAIIKLRFSILVLYVMRKAITDARCERSVQIDSALTIEVSSGFVDVQILKDWSKRVTPVKLLRRRLRLRIHVDHKVGVARKQRHLPLRVATIGTMGIPIDEFANRQSISGFSGRTGRASSHIFSVVSKWCA